MEEMTSSLHAIRLFTDLSETECKCCSPEEYNCSCWDVMIFASYTEYKGLMSKIKCSLKLLYAFLSSRECRATQVSLMLQSLREGFRSQGLKWTQCPRSS